MKDYKALAKVLNDEFNTSRISIVIVKPLHDEDFKECEMVCVDNIMVARADASLESILEAVRGYF